MWERFQNWLENYKERKREKKLKNALQLQIALNQLLDGGPNWAPYNIHYVPTLICSIYFESNQDMIAVDFSCEKAGIVHYMIFTPKNITEYNSGANEDPNKKEVHTIFKNSTVFIKYYSDGSENWCFS